MVRNRKTENLFGVVLYNMHSYLFDNSMPTFVSAVEIFANIRTFGIDPAAPSAQDLDNLEWLR